jgi:transposase
MDRRKNDLLDRIVSAVSCALRIPQSDLSSFYTPSLRIDLFETALKQALSDSQHKRFDEAYTRQLKTGKAWAYEEKIRDLWHHYKADAATHFLKDWHSRVIHTNLEPLKKLARTIKDCLANVVSYCSLRITNAVAEVSNIKITAIKRSGGGYRNRQNFKTATYFYCGGLNLYPE